MPNFPSPKRNNPRKIQRTGSKDSEPRYHTTNWRAVRQSVLMAEPLCRSCAELGEVVLAQMVDHIEPVRLGGNFWDTSNLQPLCNSCHAVKSAKERGR
jgi:5-methylcytosine-specific restriction protein A